MEAFDVLGDPVRRRILELLVAGERPAGDVVEVIGEEFGISQPAVSMQLKVLRDNGFATVRADGSRRLYAVATGPFAEVDTWLEQFRAFWEQRLDALQTEIVRGRLAERNLGPAGMLGPMAIRSGTSVRWKWGQGWAEGIVAEVHHDTVARTTKGEEITRNGSRDNPAYVIHQDDGTVVLKLASEVQRADGD